MMTLINGLLSNFIFALLIHDVRVYTLRADIRYVDKIVQISGTESSKNYEKYAVEEAQPSSSDPNEEEKRANPEQFCGWDTEEALSEKCRQVVEDPESELPRKFVFYKREPSGQTQTYNMVQMSIFRRNKKVKACQCPTKPVIYLEYRFSESAQVTVYTERPKEPFECPKCCPDCEGQDCCDSCLTCCEKSCKVMCCTCKYFVYCIALIDYGLGRCICGKDYATKPCCA